MNLNSFTNKAQEAVVNAQNLGMEYQSSEIEPAHLGTSSASSVKINCKASRSRNRLVSASISA